MAKKTVKKVVRRVRKVKANTSENSGVNVASSVPVNTVQENTTSVSTTVTNNVATAVEVNNEVDEWETTFNTLLEQTSELNKTTRLLTTTLKKVHKQWSRALKDARKKSSKKKKSSSAKRAPSGFAKPSVISKELCDFLGKPEGTEMARTEVTRLLTQYIKTHSLQDPSNKRVIVPDERLTSLLQVDNSSELTYFNLQKYMKRHFPKKATTSVVNTASA